MSVQPTVPKKLITDESIHEITQKEVKQQQPQPDSLNIPDIAISLTPVSLVFSWIIFFIILRKIRTILDNKMVFTVKDLQQVPCKNCQFYANNHYLKCAVQPSLVLTEEARNCSEYLPKKSNYFPKDLF